MGEELTKSLALLAERGESRGAIAVLEEARTQVAAATAPRRPSWRRAMLVSTTSAAAVLILFGTTVFLTGPFNGEDAAPPTTLTPVFRAAPVSGALGPMNGVNDLAFAPDGHLWAATGAGLVQWDIATGDFVLFTEKDGVPGRQIETVEIAPDGTVWVAGSGWIGRYDGSWQVFTADNVSQLNGQLGALAVDQEGVVWAAVASEPLARYDGSWESVAPPPGQEWPGITPAGMAVGSDGTLWLGTHSGGVFAFDGSNWRHFNEGDGAPARAWNVIAAPNGTIWAWGGGYYTDPELSSYVPATGFAHFDGTTWRTFTVDDGLLSNDGSVVVAPDGTVWVVHAELGPDHEPEPIGLSRFDGATWTTYPEIGGDRNGSGSGAVASADGTLWMPSASGIIAFDGSDTTRLIVPEELATPPVPPFTLIPDPEQTPVRVSTMIGDFEFTTLRTPGQDVFDTESTPFGWMAHSGHGLSVGRWSDLGRRADRCGGLVDHGRWPRSHCVRLGINSLLVGWSRLG